MVMVMVMVVVNGGACGAVYLFYIRAYFIGRIKMNNLTDALRSAAISDSNHDVTRGKMDCVAECVLSVFLGVDSNWNSKLSGDNSETTGGSVNIDSGMGSGAAVTVQVVEDLSVQKMVKVSIYFIRLRFYVSCFRYSFSVNRCSVLVKWRLLRLHCLLSLSMSMPRLELQIWRLIL